MFSFWSQPETQQAPQVQARVQVHPKLNQINHLNIIDELKKFQQSGELKKTIVQQKEEKNPNPVWTEILEIRKKVLKVKEVNIGVEERVKCLEKEVKDLKNIIRQFVDNTDLHIVVPGDWA